jgi:hypothetical protein
MKLENVGRHPALAKASATTRYNNLRKTKMPVSANYQGIAFHQVAK